MSDTFSSASYRKSARRQFRLSVMLVTALAASAFALGFSLPIKPAQHVIHDDDAHSLVGWSLLSISEIVRRRHGLIPFTNHLPFLNSILCSTADVQMSSLFVPMLTTQPAWPERDFRHDLSESTGNVDVTRLSHRNRSFYRCYDRP